MLKPLLLAGLAAAAFIPSIASAQSDCQTQRHDNRVVGTVVGAGLGALLGNVITGHGGKPGGTIIGGVGGAVVGNSVGASTVRCGENQYGYYDSNGQWMPRTSTAYGYYDANGRWVATSGGSAQGYGQNGYNQNGYNQNGYNQNRYAAPTAPYYGHDASYTDRSGQTDFRDRENHLDQMIRQQTADGSLSGRESRQAMRQLSYIRRMDAYYSQNYGQMSSEQRADLDRRLTTLHDSLHEANSQQ